MLPVGQTIVVRGLSAFPQLTYIYMASTGHLFLDYSARKLRQMGGRIEDCLGHLNDDQIWARGAESENAVGNLVLHLAGNVRQWIVAGAGGQPDIRQRNTEFAARGGLPAAELKQHLRAVLSDAIAVIESLAPERLSERLTVQGYDVTVLEAIYHVVEHFSGHTGQIVFATKMLTGEDLGYHKYLSGNATHSNQTP